MHHSCTAVHTQVVAMEIPYTITSMHSCQYTPPLSRRIACFHVGGTAGHYLQGANGWHGVLLMSPSPISMQAGVDLVEFPPHLHTLCPDFVKMHTCCHFKHKTLILHNIMYNSACLVGYYETILCSSDTGTYIENRILLYIITYTYLHITHYDKLCANSYLLIFTATMNGLGNLYLL